MSGSPSFKVGDVCKFQNGGTPSKSHDRYFKGKTPWITGADITSPVVTTARSFITDEAIENSATNRVPAGTALLVTRTSVGKVAIAGVDLCFSQDITALTPNPNRLNTAYLIQFLKTKQAHFERHARGATIKGVTREVVADLHIPLPPLAEQRRIAAILDKADSLRAHRRAALAQLDTLIQSIFLDMFGDPRVNERLWPKVPIERLIIDLRGGASLEPDDFFDSGFPILHKGAIKKNGEIGLDDKKKTFATADYVAANQRCVVNRDFLAVTLRDLVPSGPNIGLVANLRKGPYDEYLLAQGAYAFQIDLDRVVPEYLVYLSNMPNFRSVLRQNAVGSTQIHIRTPIYLAISVPLPSIEVQREFARRISAIEKLKVAHRASLADMDAFFASLQRRAFRGEL